MSKIEWTIFLVKIILVLLVGIEDDNEDFQSAFSILKYFQVTSGFLYGLFIGKLLNVD